MNRKDEIQELYDISDKISFLSSILFSCNIIVAFVLIFDFEYRNIFLMSGLILTIGYVILTNINEIYFSNIAENERRKSLLKESFHVNTTIKETIKYYNNTEQPSFEKLGLNCYESAFFTKNVVNKMLPVNIIKISIFLIIYIILMINLKNMDLLLIITQTIFSAEILFYFIKLCYYKFQLDKIYKNFQDIFFISGLYNRDSKVLLLDSILDYECLKSYCKISTSSKIFFKNNEKWTKDWGKIYLKIKTKNSNVYNENSDKE